MIMTGITTIARFIKKVVASDVFAPTPCWRPNPIARNEKMLFTACIAEEASKPWPNHVIKPYTNPVQSTPTNENSW